MPQSLLQFLILNPYYTVGFVEGEGCFTAYLGTMVTNKWGLQPCFEFIITQNTGDIVLLKAIAEFFKVGQVYSNNNYVSMFTVRKLTDIVSTIVPFFQKYKLLGTKQLEFIKWLDIIELCSSKAHLGSDLSNRDALINMAKICLDLNSKRINPQKNLRLQIIIEWLESLETVPTMAQKLELKSKLTIALINVKKSV